MDYLKQLNTLDLSKLHFYSYGYVVEENGGSDVAKIYPYEKLYDIGKVGDLSKPIDKEIKWKEEKLKKDPSNKGDKFEEWEKANEEKKVKLRESYYILASWAHMFQGNRTTPPYLGVGEKVMLFRYGNNDEFYWDTIRTDLQLRKNETVNWHFRGDKSGYSMTFSPGGQYISIVTNDKDDDEVFTFKIDGGDSLAYLHWTDKCDNHFLTLDYGKKIAALKFGDHILLKTNKNYIVQADKIRIECGGDELIKWLIDLMNALLAETHIGNLGIPTPLTSGSKAAYQALLKRLQKCFLLKKVPDSVKKIKVCTDSQLDDAGGSVSLESSGPAYTYTE